MFLARLPDDWATRGRSSQQQPLSVERAVAEQRVEVSAARASLGPSAPVLAPRKDAPLVVADRSVGSRAAGLAAACDSASRVQAGATYDDRVYATSSKRSRASVWDTWCLFHGRWFGSGPGAPPILPLTPESVRCVMAMLISGGYRSAPNYLSRAKDGHMASHEWTSMLAREQRRANAAARRGQGPAHQSAELPVSDLVDAALGDEPLVPHGPVGFLNYCVVASFFLLREIEASLMLASSVSFDRVALQVTVLLPVSKTDPRALACKRSWGCVCEGGVEDHALTTPLLLSTACC